MAAIKSGMNDPHAEEFIRTAADWATYMANERAADTVADLCLADERLCPSLVKGLLNHASGWNRSYEIAYYVIERHPELRELVVAWVADAQKFWAEGMRLADEMLKREKEGHPIGERDPILSRLPPAAKDRVNRAIEKARAEERQLAPNKPK